MIDRQFEIKASALRVYTCLLACRYIESGGKEYDAPWLKNAKTVLRGKDGKFKGKNTEGGLEKVKEAGEKVFGQIADLGEQAKSLTVEEVTRIDNFLHSEAFKEVLSFFSNNEARRDSKEIAAHFKEVKQELDEADGDIHKIIEIAKGEILNSKTISAAALTGATMAAGVYISPLIPVLVGSLTITRETASLGNLFRLEGVIPGLESIADRAPLLEVVKSFVVGGVEQVTYSAAMAAAVTSLAGLHILLKGLI